MKALVQRVSRASVSVEGARIADIGHGYLILLGVKRGDSEADSAFLASKTAALRVFADDEGKMNRSIMDVGGSALVVSQFTLHADTRKGNRPSFINAASPEIANALYERYCDALGRILGAHRVAMGRFQAMMQVELVNDGPVTIELRSRNEDA